MPETANRFLTACQVAVAVALEEDDPRRSEALKSAPHALVDEENWPNRLFELGDVVDAEWGLPSVVLMVCDSPWITFEDLASGRPHRRIDAILDLFDFDVCAHEIQAGYWSWVETAHEWAKDPTTALLRTSAEYSVNFAGGFASGWFGAPWAAGPIGKAAAWLFEDRTQPSAPIFEIAKFLMILNLMADEDGNLPEAEAGQFLGVAREQRERAAQDLVVNGGSQVTQERYRAWSVVVGILQGDEALEVDALPRLTNMSMSEARELLQSIGLSMAYVDVGRLAGQGRVPWREGGWHIVGQDPDPGTAIKPDQPVGVAILKPGERAIGLPKTRAMVEAHL